MILEGYCNEVRSKRVVTDLPSGSLSVNLRIAEEIQKVDLPKLLKIIEELRKGLLEIAVLYPEDNIARMTLERAEQIVV